MKEYVFAVTFSGRKFDPVTISDLFRHSLPLNGVTLENKPYKKMQLNCNCNDKTTLSKARKLAKAMNMDYQRLSTKNVVQQPENASN